MKLFFTILLTALMVTLTSCDNGGETDLNDLDFLMNQDADSKAGAQSDNNQTDNPPGAAGEDYLDGTIAEIVRENPVRALQLEPVMPGEELVVFHTNKGDITLRLFPEEAPLAVENFLTHARNGFYDGVIFHRVINNFMIQSGDPTGTGAGGESIWGEPFGLEESFNLRHFRGALAMAHAGGAMGSQFYIVHSPSLAPQYQLGFQEMLNDMDNFIGEFSDGHRVYIRDIHLPEMYEFFLEHGGTPHLDWIYGNAQGHTVFGHVVEGMDVVDAIAGTPVGAGDRPVDEVIIERISFIIAG